VQTPSPDNGADVFPTLDGSTLDRPSKRFADVGSGRQVGRAKADFIPGSHESPTAVSRLLNGRHTFTHHLYHHYDVEPGLRQRQDGTSTRGTAFYILTLMYVTV